MHLIVSHTPQTPIPDIKIRITIIIILLSSGGINGHVVRVQRRNICVKWSRVVIVWDEYDMDESRVEYNLDE